MSTEKQVSLNMSDLQGLIAGAVAAAVAEARKPEPLTERQEKEIAQAQEGRRATAESVLEEIEAKKQGQLICTHKHATGESHGVFIEGSDYILCQKCQAKIRAGVAPEGYKGSFIYDTNKFNEIFQSLRTADM